VWGASPKTLATLLNLRDGASGRCHWPASRTIRRSAVSIFKALTAIKLPIKPAAAGVNCVPCSGWPPRTMTCRVNHISFPGPDASLQKLTAPAQGPPERSRRSVTFGAEIEPVVEAVLILGDSEVTGSSATRIRPEENLGQRLRPLVHSAVCELGRDPARCFRSQATRHCRAIFAPRSKQPLNSMMLCWPVARTRSRRLSPAGQGHAVLDIAVHAARCGRVPVQRRANAGSTPDFASARKRFRSRSCCGASPRRRMTSVPTYCCGR